MYPILIHGSIILELPFLQLVAVALFWTGIFMPALLNRNFRAWLAYVSLVSSILLLGYFNLTLFLLYLPPVLIPLTLLVYFGKTLLPNQEPLITDIGERARGPLSPAMRHYTRRLTQLWCVIFAIMTVEAIFLTFLGKKELWSLFTNVFNYIAVGILFTGEFWWRKHRFPEHNHPSFFDYLQIIAGSFTRK